VFVVYREVVDLWRVVADLRRDSMAGLGFAPESIAELTAWWARSAASLRVERDWRWRVDSMVGVRAALIVWMAVVAAR